MQNFLKVFTVSKIVSLLSADELNLLVTKIVSLLSADELKLLLLLSNSAFVMK